MTKHPHHIRIVLEVHAVTCPGVWLCQNGDVELSINSLGYSFRSLPMPPRFPLCFHETFTIEGYYSNVDNLTGLEKAIANESMEFAIWQNGRRLAHYIGKMAILLQTHQNAKPHMATDLIMSRASCFPGSIAPKIELTANLEIIDKCRGCEVSYMKSLRRPPWRVESALATSEHVSRKCNEFRRQRPVCHTRINSRSRLEYQFKPLHRHNSDLDETMYCNECLMKIANDRHCPMDSVYDCRHFVHKYNTSCQHQHENQMQDDNSFEHSKNCDICQNYRKFFQLFPGW